MPPTQVGTSMQPSDLPVASSCRHRKEPPWRWRRLARLDLFRHHC